jgi:hypothetical protein
MRWSGNFLSKNFPKSFLPKSKFVVVAFVEVELKLVFESLRSFDARNEVCVVSKLVEYVGVEGVDRE